MAFATREVAYKATVSGFDRAEKAIEDTDRALDGAVDGAGKAGTALKGAGDKAKAGGAGFEAFEKQIGGLNKLLTGFGAVGIPGAVMALLDLRETVIGWTDAGKAATAQAEATAGAVDSMVGKLKAQADATKVTTDATWAMINAQVAQELAGRGLTQTTAEIIEKQTAYAKVLRDLAIHKERNTGLDGFSQREGTAILGQQTLLAQRADQLRGELTELNATWEQQKAALASATTLLNTATSAIDRQGAAAKAARPDLLGLLDAIDLGNLPALDLESVLGGSGAGFDADKLTTDLLGPVNDSAAAMAEALADAYVTSGQQARDEIAKLAADTAAAAAKIADSWSDGPTAALEAFGQGIAQQIAAAILLGDSVEEAAARALEGLAAQAFGEMLFQGAMALAALGKGLLTYDPLAFAAAKAHAASAAAFGVIAGGAAIGASALGGGGGGRGEPPRALGDAERERTTSAGGGGGGASMSTTNNFNFAGQSLYTDRDVQRAVRAALKASEDAPGLPRPDLTKIGRA